MSCRRNGLRKRVGRALGAEEREKWDSSREEGPGRGKVLACERESRCEQFGEANGERVSTFYFVYFCIMSKLYNI